MFGQRQTGNPKTKAVKPKPKPLVRARPQQAETVMSTATGAHTEEPQHESRSFGRQHQINPESYHFDDSEYVPETYLERIALGLGPESNHPATSSSSASQQDSHDVGASDQGQRSPGSTRTPRSPSKSSKSPTLDRGSPEAARFKGSYLAGLPKLPPEEIMIISRTRTHDGRVVPASVRTTAGGEAIESPRSGLSASVTNPSLAREAKVGLRRAREEEKMRARERAWREAMLGISDDLRPASPLDTPENIVRTSLSQPSNSAGQAEAKDLDNEESLAASYRRIVESEDHGFSASGDQGGFTLPPDQMAFFSAAPNNGKTSNSTPFGSPVHEMFKLAQAHAKVPSYMAQTSASHRRHAVETSGKDKPAPLAQQTTKKNVVRKHQNAPAPSQQVQSMSEGFEDGEVENINAALARSGIVSQQVEIPPTSAKSVASGHSVAGLTPSPSSSTTQLSSDGNHNKTREPARLTQRLAQRSRLRELLQEQREWDAKQKALLIQDRKEIHELKKKKIIEERSKDAAKLAEECRQTQEAARRAMEQEIEARRREAEMRKQEHKRIRKRLELIRAAKEAEEKRRQQEEEARLYDEMMREIEEKKQQIAAKVQHYREMELRNHPEFAKRKRGTSMRGEGSDMPFLANCGSRILSSQRHESRGPRGQSPPSAITSTPASPQQNPTNGSSSPPLRVESSPISPPAMVGEPDSSAQNSVGPLSI